MSERDRYARQRVLPQIGDEGQERLLGSRVTVMGSGALGCAQAQLLARAGVGFIRLVDRDFVEIENLHRQVLFDEEDAARRAPKAKAAAEKLRRMNGDVAIEPVIADMTPRNVDEILGSVDLVLDATDNIETRYIINDYCVREGIPWVYGGITGTEGLVMPIVPVTGPCLRCLFPEPPPPGALLTCDVAGVLNTGPALVASLQVTAALRILVGSSPDPHLLSVDPWLSSFRRIDLAKEPACRTCGERRFDFLEDDPSSRAKVLCGQYAVQISPAGSQGIDLEALAARLSEIAEVEKDDHLLQVRTGEHELFVFADGRTIVRGTSDIAEARVLYSRFVGT